jgi:outer membrane protein TolC
MKVFSKQIVLIAALLGACATVFAQQTSEKVLRLTVKEAQDYALQNNRNVWNAGLSVSEAQKKTWETISAGLPKVDASITYQNMMGFKMSFAGMDIAMVPTSNFQTTVSQLLFSGSYWVGIKMSKLGEELSEIARQQTELDVKQQTQSAYYAALVIGENLKILGQNLENIETLAKKVEDMVRIGVAEQTDALQLKVQQATMVNAIKSLERNSELAYNLLRFQLGVEADTEIVLTQTIDDLMGTSNAVEMLAKEFDVDANYTVQLMYGQVELADMMINLERSASLPTVAAYYNYTHKIAKSTFDMSDRKSVV